MDNIPNYEAFLREQITALRLQKGVSEHRMSLELGKSGSYVRTITSGMALPSLRELFNIFAYFDITPAEFFAGFESRNQKRAAVQEQIHQLQDADLDKVSLFLSWIGK